MVERSLAEHSPQRKKDAMLFSSLILVSDGFRLVVEE
jgi:hypothetical protein